MKTKLKTPLILICLFLTLPLKSQVLTVRDVFDAQVGDYYTYELVKHYAASDYFFRKVINKETFGNDSLRITYFEAGNVFQSNQYIRKTRTFSKTYTQLDSPYFDRFDQMDTTIYFFRTP